MQYFCENKRRRRKEFTYVFDCTKIYLREDTEDCRDLPMGGLGGDDQRGGDFSHKYTSSGGLNYKCISIQTKFFNNPQDTLKRRVGWSGWLPPRAKVKVCAQDGEPQGQKELTVLQDSIF